jgi:histidinol phosphatase-like enzyme
MSKQLLFADLDGTLIETVSGKTFPKGIWDMKFKFDVLEAINKVVLKH